MGDLESQSTNSQSAHPWSFQLFTVLLLMLFAMSALTVYVAIQNSQNAQKIKDLQNLYMDDRFKPEEDSDEVIMTKQTIRAARSVDGSGEVCESQFYPNLNVTPSAHLVGSDSMNPGDNTNDGYIKCGWSCQYHGHVHGGMKAENGSIVVPIDGIYLVYSQVKIFYDGGEHNPIHYGHSTVLSYPNNSKLKVLQGTNTGSTKRTYSAHHQSGLFYIPKGAKIHVDLWQKTKLSIANNVRYDPESTYLGAYYVSGCIKDGCAELQSYD